MSGELPARGMQDRCGASRTGTGPGKAAGRGVGKEYAGRQVGYIVGRTTGRYYRRQVSD